MRWLNSILVTSSKKVKRDQIGRRGRSLDFTTPTDPPLRENLLKMLLLSSMLMIPYVSIKLIRVFIKWEMYFELWNKEIFQKIQVMPPVNVLSKKHGKPRFNVYLTYRLSLHLLKILLTAILMISNVSINFITVFIRWEIYSEL